MRGKGIHYDTGTRMDNGWTRETFDSSTAKREIQIIADELHCTAVRITGSDPDRLATAAEYAAEAGLEVWFSPFPCGLTADEMLPLFVECAARAGVGADADQQREQSECDQRGERGVF